MGIFRIFFWSLTSLDFFLVCFSSAVFLEPNSKPNSVAFFLSLSSFLSRFRPSVKARRESFFKGLRSLKRHHLVINEMALNNLIRNAFMSTLIVQATPIFQRFVYYTLWNKCWTKVFYSIQSIGSNYLTWSRLKITSYEINVVYFIWYKYDFTTLKLVLCSSLWKYIKKNLWMHLCQH